jgi:Protein of unknown function (DUF5818)
MKKRSWRRKRIGESTWLFLAITLLIAAVPKSRLTSFTVSASTLQPGAQNEREGNETGNEATLRTFTGKIVSLNGALFILRDDADQVWYHLDDQSTARRFAGKNVNVKGKLDVATDVIHVQSIEAQPDSNAPNQSSD